MADQGPQGPDRAQVTPEQLAKVRKMLIRLAALVTPPGDFGVQLLRRDRNGGDIEYQLFADTHPHGRQIAWVQSTRHDAEFIQACIAQACLFADLLSAPAPPQEPPAPDLAALRKEIEGWLADVESREAGVSLDSLSMASMNAQAAAYIKVLARLDAREKGGQ